MSATADPLLVVLGAPNGRAGALSPVALTRTATAIDVHANHPNSRVHPTGGFGTHFNTSPEPHHIHVARALTARGINPRLILPGVPSSNTAEDATGSCQRARALGIQKLLVVTSDFHCERAAILFDRERGDLTVEMCPADSGDLDPELVRGCEAHERSALERLRSI